MLKERTEHDQRQIKDELIMWEASGPRTGLSVGLMTRIRQVHPVPDHHPHQTSHFLQLHPANGELV